MLSNSQKTLRIIFKLKKTSKKAQIYLHLTIMNIKFKKMSILIILFLRAKKKYTDLFQ